MIAFSMNKPFVSEFDVYTGQWDIKGTSFSTFFEQIIFLSLLWICPNIYLSQLDKIPHKTGQKIRS